MWTELLSIRATPRNVNFQIVVWVRHSIPLPPLRVPLEAGLAHTHTVTAILTELVELLFAAVVSADLFAPDRIRRRPDRCDLLVPNQPQPLYHQRSSSRASSLLTLHCCL